MTGVELASAAAGADTAGMSLLYAILLALALVCFVAAFRGGTRRAAPLDWVALGLAVWVAVPLIAQIHALWVTHGH